MRFGLALIACLAAPAVAETQQTRNVTGSLAYRERIALPPEAEIVLELRDDTGALIATESRPTEGAQVPLPFALEAPAGPALSLRAALRTGGEIRWLGGPVEVPAGEAAADLGVVPLQGFRQMGFASTLSCGELTVELGFIGPGARLRIGGSYLDLGPERTASGAKFTAPDDPETWIWTKGDVATLQLSGATFPECREALPEARYTARGNEPGWTLEVADGQMRYVGDYGATERAAPLPEPETVDGARRYAAEGADLALTLELGLCHDSMTGMPYPDRATVETGGTRLTGCGGDPMDLLTAHSWRVEDIDGRGLIDASNVTIAFAPGGRVSGSGGCNRYTGAAKLSGEGLRFGPLASTMMACPEALMTQERALFAALERADRFDIAPDGALLVLAGDRAVVRARR